MEKGYNYCACFFAFLILIFKTVNGQEKIGEIGIDADERNITNLSGALNDSISFHLIVNKSKEKQNFRTSVVFFDLLGRSKTVSIDESEKRPTYLTFHVRFP